MSDTESSRREAVPFDPYHFEKLARQGQPSSPRATFRDIYERHHWRGSQSRSGPGADASQVQALQRLIPQLLSEYRIGSLLDLPCGDYSWMRDVPLPDTRYVGADLLEEVVAPLARTQQDARHEFLVLDLTSDPLPPAELLLCRDCLVHLSFADIRLAVANILRSRIPWLLTTTFPRSESNDDIVTGDWRVLNLERAPFGFPPPERLLNEECTEGDGVFSDKSLGMWRTAHLTKLPFIDG
jgi:hypothetical protein